MPTPSEPQQLLNQMCLDETLDTAYHWLQSTIFKHTIQAESWQQHKQELKKQLLSGRYCLKVLTRVCHNGVPQDLYQSDDLLVLKAIGLVLGEHFLPKLSGCCFEPGGLVGIETAVQEVDSFLLASPKSLVIRGHVPDILTHMDHDILYRKLVEYLPQEKYLLRLLWQYLNQTSYVDGEYLDTKKGISGDSPLTSLMTSLYLLPLDNVLSSQRSFYVRFMDEWLLIGQTRWALFKACEIASQVLDQVGLTLLIDPISQIKAEKGVEFLGYQFFTRQPAVKKSPLAWHQQDFCFEESGGAGREDFSDKGDGQKNARVSHLTTIKEKNRLHRLSLTTSSNIALLSGAALLVGNGWRDASAGVVYTDPVDVNTQEIAVDIDNDGDTEVFMRFGPLSGVAASDIRVEQSNSAGMRMVATFDPYGSSSNWYGKALAANATISAGQTFAAGNYGVLVYSSQGPWVNATNRYLGIKFLRGGNTHYGWIRMSVSGASNFSPTMYDYAYEDTPDTAILAGQMPASNAAPVVDLNAGGGGIDVSRSFTEDGGAVTVAPVAAVTDADGDEINSVTITLTNNLDGGAEALFLGSATNVGIAGSGTTTLTLSDTGTTTNAQFQTALQTVTYNNTSNIPNTTARSITVVANDGTDNSTTATVTMSVTASNDPPTDISLNSTDVDENKSINTVVGTLSATDPDG